MVKLVTGEEFVAGYKEEENKDGKMLFHNPSKFQPMQTEQGVAVAMRPFTDYGGYDFITIHESHIIFVAEAEKEPFANAWNEQFGSGLVLPPEQHLIT